MQGIVLDPQVLRPRTAVVKRGTHPVATAPQRGTVKQAVRQTIANGGGAPAAPARARARGPESRQVNGKTKTCAWGFRPGTNYCNPAPARVDTQVVVRKPVADTVIHVHRGPQPGTGSGGAVGAAAGGAAGAAAGGAAGSLAKTLGGYLAANAAAKLAFKGVKVIASKTPAGRLVSGGYAAYRAGKALRASKPLKAIGPVK